MSTPRDAQAPAPLELRLGDFYTAALWGGVLGMTFVSLLTAALQTQGAPRLALLLAAVAAATTGAGLLALRTWLRLDPASGQIALRRGLWRPLWTARRWPLSALTAVTLVTDEAPPHQRLPYEDDDEDSPPPPPPLRTHFARLTLGAHTLALPAVEDEAEARRLAEAIAALARLPLTRARAEEPGRRWRRWGLWLALANAALIAAWAVTAVATSAPPAEVQARLQQPWAPAPYPAPPQRSRPLQPQDRLRPGDRLWVRWRDAWYAAELLAPPTPHHLRVRYRGYGNQHDEDVHPDRVRLPTRR